jgi:hypothetical protein
MPGVLATPIASHAEMKSKVLIWAFRQGIFPKNGNKSADRFESACEIRLSAHPNFAAVSALPRRDLPEIAQTDLPVAPVSRSCSASCCAGRSIVEYWNRPPRKTKGQNQCRHFTEA